MARIDEAHVRRGSRDLIAEGGLPLELVTITHGVAHWCISFRGIASQQVVDIPIPGLRHPSNSALFCDQDLMRPVPEP